MSNRIRINKVHFPVTALGYGRRVGIWTQGCSIHCPGCINRDTWEFDDTKALAIGPFVAALNPWLAQADGVTVSGGEPFDQPEALAHLLRELRPRLAGDILVYSGYARERLARRHAAILSHVDVLISEPYQPQWGTTLTLRGSDNQHITLLSELARRRYPANVDTRPWEATRRMDLVVDGGTVWMAGIPRAGEMREVQRRLAEAGLACSTSDQP